jgi:hypothetical protein
MRCLYQAVAFEELRAGGKAATREFFFSDLAELVLPAHTLVDPSNAEVEPPQDGRFQIWRKMDDFVDRVCDASIAIEPMRILLTSKVAIL